ncbi:MAG: carbohydrate-binding protein [Bacteroidales bacterium]|nr:carbohydrate-binding protein [Bacteroidales bacterium]
MKRIVTSICSFLLVCVCAFAQGQSLWRIQNRLSNNDLASDGSTLWIVEAGNGRDVRIKNAVSGKYLSDCPLFIEGFTYDSRSSAGWYTISGDGKYLVEKVDGYAFDVVDREKDYVSHWSFIREESDRVPYVLGKDSVTESSFLGERCAKALSPTEIVSNYHGERSWKLTRDISAFPQFTSKGNTLVPALYNMALEESLLDIREEDGTFMAGFLWPQTWTRDVVYSIYFAYSWILPEISRKTLEKQTLKNPSEALQDTGSGGSWPISTDRVVWALAAWEYYLASGDKDWLRQTYEGLSYTAHKDIHVAYDRNIHLFRGETASMDWRIHTYPNWFTNVNIGESFSCATNSLHFFLYKFLVVAGREIGAPKDEITLWETMCGELREGINANFWDEEQGVYKCYLYPEFLGYRPSQRVGVMSSGLASLLGVASTQQVAQVLANYPVYAYGGSVLYPSKPDSYAYHNKSVWPVWQTPLMYAAKKNGNYKVAEHLAKTAIRSGALFLTHKENMTYDTGFDENTALNSDRQLWSVASYISIVYRILFGIELTENGMSINPMMPEWMGGEMSLKGLRYRKATVDITVTGKGTEIESIYVNGHAKKPGYVLPAGARGKHTVKITMREAPDDSKINLVEAGPGKCWSPEEPVIRYENQYVFWTAVPGVTYRLYGRDSMIDNVHSPLNIAALPEGYYCVCAVDGNGVESDLSNPILKAGFSDSRKVGVMDYRESHKDIDIQIEVPEDGDYLVWFTGTNGRGPHDTYCAIRSLFVDGQDTATIILEAFGDWNEKTLTNHVLLKNLSKGAHTLTLKLNPEARGYDNNMSFNKANMNDLFIESINIISCTR